jgi:L-fucose mutarotase/ribose pyranase (RbsD/FucU family)
MKRTLTPEDCLRTLPDPKLDARATVAADDGLRGAELRRAVLQLAQLDHVSETSLVRKAVVQTRGQVPPVGE